MDVETPSKLTVHLPHKCKLFFYFDKFEAGSKWEFHVVSK